MYPTSVPLKDFLVTSNGLIGWSLKDENGNPIPKPSNQTILSVWQSISATPAADGISYKVKRAREYPPIQDLADALVKKSSADPVIKADGIKQEQDYYEACLAIKAKYPKTLT